MARLLAFDYGMKRCGIAVTDPLQIIATALETVPTSDIFPFLDNYLKKEDVEGFVIGWPLHKDGNEMKISAEIRKFVEKLRSKYKHIGINFEDEHFTSKMAVMTMVEANFKKKDRRKKENIDKISAVLILQSYMERRKI